MVTVIKVGGIVLVVIGGLTILVGCGFCAFITWTVGYAVISFLIGGIQHVTGK